MPPQTAFYVVAAVATAALVGQLARLSRLMVNRRQFLGYIEKLVAGGDLDRAFKLAHVHDGPVARLCRLALTEIQRGQGARVAADLAREAPREVARASWMAWPARIAGVVAVIAGAVVLARTPYRRGDSTFAVVGGWSALVAILDLLALRAERRLVADIGVTARNLAGLAT